MLKNSIEHKLRSWTLSHAVLLLIGVSVSLVYKDLIPIIFVGYLSFVFLLTQCWAAFSRFSPIIGWANLVTIGRFIGICISLLLIPKTSPWYLAIALTFFVLLDLLDGYLARKFDQSSVAGMHLDMEVDAIFVMLMCTHFYLHEAVGIWILIPGLLRYLYVICISVFPKNDFVESKQRYASTFAGIFFAVLLLSIVIDEPFRSYLLGIGSLLIIISFGTSFIQYFLWKAK